MHGISFQNYSYSITPDYVTSSVLCPCNQSLSSSFLSFSFIVTPFVCIFRDGFGVIRVVRFFVCVEGKVS